MEDLLNDLMNTYSFTRTAICNIAFEIYDTSYVKSKKEKKDHMKTFIIKMQKVKESYWKGLLITVDSYCKMKDTLKKIYLSINNYALNLDYERKLSLCLGYIFRLKKTENY